jgi:hypothetical protein
MYNNIKKRIDMERLLKEILIITLVEKYQQDIRWKENPSPQQITVLILGRNTTTTTTTTTNNNNVPLLPLYIQNVQESY